MGFSLKAGKGANMTKLFTVNGKSYRAKEFDFNFLCDLEDQNLSLEDIDKKPMIFPFEVKKNGVYYPAGTEVPTGSKKGAEKPLSSQPGKVDKPKKKEIQAKEEAAVEEKTAKYSEEDLNMPYMKLKSLAISEGFKVNKTAKADDIKEMLRTL